MKITTSLRHHQGASFEEVLEATRAAEVLGFEAIFLPDHLLPLDTLHADKQRRAGYTAERSVPHGPTDAWTFLAGLACGTSTIRIGTLVCNSMFRPPGMLAIQVANVNEMSHGRVDLGIGAGWIAAEHSAYGLGFPPLGTRFRMLEEQLQILHGLWETPPAQRFSFKGEFYDLLDAAPLPHHVHLRPRLLVGGRGLEKTPRLGALYADELNATADRLEDCLEFFARADRFCEENGRDPSTLKRSAQIQVCIGEDEADMARQAQLVGSSVENLRAKMFTGTPDQLIEFLKTYEEYGFSRVNLSRRLPVDLPGLRLIGEEVLPHFERARAVELPEAVASEASPPGDGPRPAR
jgi:alkanesulfonate monooxygenase SsuD/methylene tetrahydromethanopterin reductase-like flavin-dependent oxidoreductase (luciferase family)